MYITAIYSISNIAEILYIGLGVQETGSLEILGSESLTRTKNSISEKRRSEFYRLQ